MWYGKWTAKAARKYMEKVLSPDWTLDGDGGDYEVRDAYRPGQVWRGRTPAKALKAAGVWLPPDCSDYH